MVGRGVFGSFASTIGLVLLPVGATSQAISTYGSGPEARACYEAAQRAADFDEASPGAPKSCTAALERGELGTRFRAATHVNRGILNAALEKFESALRDYDAAMGIFPDYGAIYVNRGNIFFLRKSYDTAIAEYTKALKAEMVEYQVAHLNRGMAHENLGHYRDAETDYRRALELAPNWTLAEAKLARVLTRKD